MDSRCVRVKEREGEHRGCSKQTIWQLHSPTTTAPPLLQLHPLNLLAHSKQGTFFSQSILAKTADLKAFSTQHTHILERQMRSKHLRCFIPFKCTLIYTTLWLQAKPSFYCYSLLPSSISVFSVYNILYFMNERAAVYSL